MSNGRPRQAEVTVLVSMTGFGAARREVGGVGVTVEVKSVNGRFFKAHVRAPQSLHAHEQEIEAAVRARVRRGSVTVSIDVQERRPEARARVDEEVVRAYQEVFRRLGVPEAPLATLPGVIVEARSEPPPELWDGVQAALREALEALVSMRKTEGGALERALSEACGRIGKHLERVRERAPTVVREYQDKLAQRLQQLVGGAAPVPPELVARELAVFADRCDITEEMDRLASHLEQARTLLAGADEAGKTLEFLIQELFREINTIGSKSADTQLSRLVIDMKTEVERLKEQVANVE